jgi:predicted ester cyclase
MTTSNGHGERLHKLYEGVWNGENPDVADEFVHPEYLIHDREIADELRGPELYTKLASMTRESFPDMEFTIGDTVAAGDKVALRWTMTGTHDGPMFGIEPTGKEVELTAIEINRFEDGALVETWTQSDMLGLMQQLGVVASRNGDG